MSFSRSYNLVRDLIQIGVTTCPPEITIANLAKIFVEKDSEALIILNHSDGGNAIGMGIQAERRSPIDLFDEKRDAARRSTLKQREE